ncbi:MAG TPA: heparinase II/III family protein, partial [Armatimonadota bacterium]|nr:heparinase II/III family protein [Armatimonadota bacterium]
YAQLYPTLPVNTGPAGRGRIMAQSLSECSWLLRVMTAYDLLYNALSVEERVTIEEDFIRPDVYDRFPYSFGLHNIQCWHNACYAAAGYLLGDDALIERSLSGNIGFYEQMKRGILDDGMWFERSMGYHYYTLSAIMLHCEAARHNGLNLHEDDKIKRMFLLPMRMSQPNLVPPSLSDQGYRSSRIAVDSIERALGWYGDDEFARVLAYMYATGSKRTSRAALDYGGDLPDQAEAPSLPSANLTGTGVAILRAGEGASARWALLRYGDHGGGHGHPDKLEIILYGLGQTLMPDLGNPGYGTKIHGGYYKTTPGHNTVTVGGNTQKGTTGQCLAFHGEGPFQVAVGESTGAYPDTTLRRTLVMGPGFLADVYRVEAPEPTQIDYVLRSFGELSISPDPTPTEGALGDEKGYRYMNHVSETAPVAGSWQAQWTLAKPEGGRVLVSGVLADDMKILHVDAPGVPGRERLGTLIIRKNAASATFAIVHQILAPGETPLAVAPAGSGIAIGGSDAIIILSPDLGPGQADEVRVLSHDGEELVVPISRP